MKQVWLAAPKLAKSPIVFYCGFSTAKQYSHESKRADEQLRELTQARLVGEMYLKYEVSNQQIKLTLRSDLIVGFCVCIG